MTFISPRLCLRLSSALFDKRSAEHRCAGSLARRNEKRAARLTRLYTDEERAAGTQCNLRPEFYVLT